MIESQETQREIYTLFRLSVILKGAISLLEILGGLIVLLIPPQTVTALGVFLTQDALSEDPDNFVAIHILQAAQHYTHHLAVFASLYLISRGALKLGLVIALLKNYLWAYPASLVVLGLFVLFQIYEIVRHQSLIVILITLFDLIVMYFIWREWRIVKERLALKQA